MPEENHMNQGPAVSSQPGVGQQTPGQQTESALTDRGHTVESSDQQHAENLRPAAPVTGREVWDETKQRLRTAKQDIDDYVRNNPAKAVFAALGLGLVLGLMRRR